jgi:hypothetical protein
MNNAVLDAEYIIVEQLLGRKPRGLEAIQVYNSDGEPSVIRVASMVDGKPFPTLFWLVDKALCYWLDQLESAGMIAQLQQQIDHDKQLQQALRDDHKSYIEQREHYMSAKIKKALQAANYYDGLSKRGVGGIANFGRIRCLHTFYAAHLVQPNTVGRLLESFES